MIKRIKIHTSNALKDTNYRFPGNYGVEKFLELFSGNWNKIACSQKTFIKTTFESHHLIGYRFFCCHILCKTEEDYDAFCLAYMFTYRDFEMGTLGLAWTGDLKNAGGVCEKNGVRFADRIPYLTVTISSVFDIFNIYSIIEAHWNRSTLAL